MPRRSLAAFGGLLVLSLLIATTPAAAQGIAGQVSDTTGGVLPGVAVEAASPALIEGSRTVFTDGGGLYNIIDLRPGEYTVTFTLPGFTTIIREGITLNAGFTATVDVELTVGGVEETVTVTGASPVVDVQNVVQQEVLTAETLDTLPIAKSLASFVAVVPGLKVGVTYANADVGGTTGDRPIGTSIHGSRAADQHVYYNGQRTNNINASAASTGGGGAQSIYFNPAAIAEISLETGQQSITNDSGGVLINVIPKEGGNTLSGTVLFNGTNGDLQADNLTDELRGAGVNPPRIKNIFDVNGGVGGPIVRDRIWFHGAYRRWGTESYQPTRFFYDNPVGWPSLPVAGSAAARYGLHGNYNPNAIRDATTQAYDQNLSWDLNGIITMQVSDNNKIAVAGTRQRRCLCYFGIDFRNASPEATWLARDRSHYWQAKWTYTASSRLLIQAGTSSNKMNWNSGPNPIASDDIVSVLDTDTGFRTRATDRYNGRDQAKGYNSSTYHSNVAVSYVTGSHTLMVGGSYLHGRPTTDWESNRGLNYEFSPDAAGTLAPSAVIMRATPQSLLNRVNEIALYASDQWTIDRLTLNLGIRYTHFDGFVPDVSLPAGPFVPQRNYQRVDDIVSWHDLTPRIGFAYDLFGDGRTALKATFARYLIGHAGDVINRENPQVFVAENARRTWNDLNGNFEPDCVLHAKGTFGGVAGIPGANGECGAISNVQFGDFLGRSTFQDEATLFGWHNRDDNWEITAGVQHELAPGVALDVVYFRRWYGNFLTLDNRAVTNANYDEYCLTGPLDSRLPGGGGELICGLYDIQPAFFGQVDNLNTFASNFGEQTEVYNGFDVTVNARLADGAFVAGGINIGRTATNDCAVRPDSPEARFCAVTPPFLTDLKLSAAYPLPWWDIEFSATIQNSPGSEIGANWTTLPAAANAVWASGGQATAMPFRTFAAGTGARVTVPLIEPGTLYGDRLNQVDFRVSKSIRMDRYNLKVIMDLYNLFNLNPTITFNNTYGSRWQNPFTILPGRFAKFGLQLDF